MHKVRTTDAFRTCLMAMGMRRVRGEELRGGGESLGKDVCSSAVIIPSKAFLAETETKKQLNN